MPDTEPDTEATAKKPTPPPPCRLYAILARRAPIGVIFRRGPSKRVQIIHWGTATDTFTPGQWFHGRIYERRSDLSPDGKFLIYFAQKINRRTTASDYTYAWTAVSRPPFLTALALWPKGDCWDGGGLFLSGREVWLNHTPGSASPHPDHRPKGLEVTHNEYGMGEDDPILLRRLARDGWRHAQEWRVEYTQTNRGFVTHVPRIQRKQNPHGWQKMTMTTTLEGFTQRDDYSVRYAEGADLALTGVDWADWDQHGRLVFAQGGAMFALAADAIGKEPPQELVNLNGNQPEAVVAPDWAKTW